MFEIISQKNFKLLEPVRNLLNCHLPLKLLRINSQKCDDSQAVFTAVRGFQIIYSELFAQKMWYCDFLPVTIKPQPLKPVTFKPRWQFQNDKKALLLVSDEFDFYIFLPNRQNKKRRQVIKAGFGFPAWHFSRFTIIDIHLMDIIQKGACYITVLLKSRFQFPFCSNFDDIESGLTTVDTVLCCIFGIFNL